jgi:hypothetical protein
MLNELYFEFEFFKWLSEFLTVPENFFYLIIYPILRYVYNQAKVVIKKAPPSQDQKIKKFSPKDEFWIGIWRRTILLSMFIGVFSAYIWSKY